MTYNVRDKRMKLGKGVARRGWEGNKEGTGGG